MNRMRQVLREVSLQRTVGFGDAVKDLGTHVICGHKVPYSRAMVYNVLHGKSKSGKLLSRIVECRPDLLRLSFVKEEVRIRARKLGWRMRPKNTDKKPNRRRHA